MSTRTLLIVAALFAGASLAAHAAKGGGGAPGGMSSGHMSAQGMANTNGPDAADRDKGRERAEDRMSDEGRRHDQSEQSHGKAKGQNTPPR